MVAIRCTAPRQGHRPGSAAERACPGHGDRARATSHSTPAAPIAPAPEHASKHKQTVLSNGTVVEAWRKNGELHREDGPAYVKRHPDGTVVEWWYRSGERHCEDGPAYVEHRRDGTVVEEWCKDGKTHREDGPAWVERHPDGTVKSEEWFVDDAEVEPWEVLGRYLMTRSVPGLSTEALKQIAKDVPWQRWSELGPDHPLVALWDTVHPTADASAD